MPAPDALRPILTALGTGGTVEMAEGVHRYVAALTAERDALAADAARLAEVLVTECGATEPGETAYAAVARILRAQAAEIQRLNTLMEPQRATLREKIEASSLGTPEAVAARESVPTELAQAAVARAAELRDDDGNTDPELLAALTDAGDRWGPLGVALVAAHLTDPAVVAARLTDSAPDVREEDPQRSPATYPHRSGDHIIIGPETFATDDGTALCWRGVTYTPIAGETPNVPDVDYPPEMRAEIDTFLASLASQETSTGDDLSAVTIGDLMLAREAAASVALDHDPRAETIALPEPEAATPQPPTNDEIRDWCRANSVAVSDRGPIGKTARAKYDAAHREA